MMHEEDGFSNNEYIKDIAKIITDYCESYEREHQKPIVKYDDAKPSIKLKYPNSTDTDFERAIHTFCPEYALTAFTKKSVYSALQTAYVVFPNNVVRFAEHAGVTKKMASVYMRYWASNGNKLSDTARSIFDKNYQSYLDNDISLAEFSKMMFNNPKAGQIILLHMQHNLLISRYHYRDFKYKSAKDRGLEFSITGNYINQVYKAQNGKCAVTGVDVCSYYASRNAVSDCVYSIDRINNNVGYVVGNIRLTTKIANMSRGVLTTPEHYKLCTQAVVYRIEQKNLPEKEKIIEILLSLKEPNTEIKYSPTVVNEESDNLLTMNDIVQQNTQSAYTYYDE